MTLPPERPIRRYHKSSKTEDLAGFWVDALGWIACYFGQLEGLSYAIIESLGSLTEKKYAPKMRYQQRTDLAKKLICAHLISLGEPELAKEWADLLQDAKAAGPLRNKILHNPLGINLLESDSLEDPDQGIVLVNLPKKPVIKLGAVQAFSQHVVALNQRMLALKQRTAI